jgi:hypothetical protein
MLLLIAVMSAVVVLGQQECERVMSEVFFLSVSLLPFLTVLFCQTTGAYFHKLAIHASRAYRGVRGRIRLPVPSFDARRWTQGYSFGDDYASQMPSDHPSVYTGGNNGNTGQEVDAGLTWDRRALLGQPLYTDMPDGVSLGDESREYYIGRSVDEEGNKQLALIRRSAREVVATGNSTFWARSNIQEYFAARQLKPAFGFRPFWRTVTSAGNRWHQLSAGTGPVFLPGEYVTMQLQIVGTNVLELRISGASGNFVQRFPQYGFSLGQPIVWKRVNSIDQDHNENKHVIPTSCRVIGAHWFFFTLTPWNGGQSVPMTCHNAYIAPGRDIVSRYASIFRTRGVDANGGELLDIVPNK